MSTIDTLPLRKLLAKDPHRPRFHFLPPRHWMNDPNGLIHWNGKVHLFYQYNPNGAFWGDLHWGHAVSPDMVHWTDLPIALAPLPGGPDEAGVFSGCAVNHDGVPTIIYTGTRGIKNEIQTQCLATSSDNLMTWHKHPGNPVISKVPAEARQTRDFRDPFVWKEGDSWYMVVGSRVADVGGVIFLYRSPNLVDWEYLNPLFSGAIERNGVIWECPNFFKLGDSWVLIVSSHLGNATGSVLYWVGSYANHRFTPEVEGILDHGELYAPLSFVDDKDRRVLFGWIRESRPVEAQKQASWSGVQSIPRVLGLDSHKRLTMVPVPEIEALRGAHRHYGPEDLSQNTALDIAGTSLDILAEFTPASSGTYGLSVACSPDRKERADIEYDATRKRLTVRRASSRTSDSEAGNVHTATHVLEAGEPLILRILLDGSVIETIANGRTSVTSRIYPIRTDGNQVQMYGAGGHLNSLDIWEMRSIWK